jgi:hypothetical protein
MQDALTVICDTIGSPEAVHPIPKTKNKFLRLLDVIMGDSPCGCMDRMFGCNSPRQLPCAEMDELFMPFIAI